MEQKTHDVLVIGGSYAGLQAALTLGRSLRSVLIIDGGKPANRYAPESHNLLMHDGTALDEMRQTAMEQVLAYPTIDRITGTAVFAAREQSVFAVTDENGHTYLGKKLLLATGLKDIMPKVPGFAECWGKSIVHCPYCHGYEIKDKNIGITTFPEAAKEFVPLVYNLNKSFLLFMEEEAGKETKQFIEGKDITVVKDGIREILHTDGQLHSVITNDGNQYRLDALFASQACEQSTELAEQLKCRMDDKFIEVGIVGQTDIPGLYAAGDCTGPMRSISIAIASGYKAGIGINNELIEDEIKRQVPYL